MCRALFSRLLLSPSDQEFIDCRLRITLSRFKDRRGKRGLVWRIGKVLRLKTKPTTPVVDLADLAANFIEKIPRIELHPRLGRPHLQCASTRGFVDVSRQG